MSQTPEVLVDPVVSRAKFDREVADYRRLESTYIRQGWWLVRAEYPELFVVFGTAHLKPPLVAFGALLDFTNYDLWPPSVKIVDPFTRVPYKANELPSHFRRRMMVAHEQMLDASNSGAPQVLTVQLQPMMMCPPDCEPFLCLPGTRAYHDHPSHTGDSWSLRRGRGEGTLFFILNALYTYGSRPMAPQYKISFAGFILQPDRMSE